MILEGSEEAQSSHSVMIVCFDLDIILANETPIILYLQISNTMIYVYLTDLVSHQSYHISHSTYQTLIQTKSATKPIQSTKSTLPLGLIPLWIIHIC